MSLTIRVVSIYAMMKFKKEIMRNKIFELKRDLLDFTKKNLTTEILAKYILENLKKCK
tara:strand:+ start:317 stop:490 length:174 start_codon:yes stop_codon:yes gene_type:complete